MYVPQGVINTAIVRDAVDMIPQHLRVFQRRQRPERPGRISYGRSLPQREVAVERLR
jgi:hypothetical protein